MQDIPSKATANSTFLLVDVETANGDIGSICQIGVAWVRENEIIRTECFLTDPEAHFDAFNIGVHGIRPQDVENAPRLFDVLPRLADEFAGEIVVSHSLFDKSAFAKAFARVGLALEERAWLDSIKIARLAWPEFLGNQGYSLGALTRHFQIEFQHHDAGEDARAAALITLAALKKTGKSITDFIGKNGAPVYGYQARYQALPPNAQGPYYGQSIVFTGELSLPREEARRIAAELGFLERASVHAGLDYLVVGKQDPLRTRGQEKSSKHRKAEAFNASGATISILGEEGFWELSALEQ